MIKHEETASDKVSSADYNQWGSFICLFYSQAVPAAPVTAMQRTLCKDACNAIVLKRPRADDYASKLPLREGNREDMIEYRMTSNLLDPRFSRGSEHLGEQASSSVLTYACCLNGVRRLFSCGASRLWLCQQHSERVRLYFGFELLSSTSRLHLRMGCYPRKLILLSSSRDDGRIYLVL